MNISENSLALGVGASCWGLFAGSVRFVSGDSPTGLDGSTQPRGCGRQYTAELQFLPAHPYARRVVLLEYGRWTWVSANVIRKVFDRRIIFNYHRPELTENEEATWLTIGTVLTYIVIAAVVRLAWSGNH